MGFGIGAFAVYCRSRVEAEGRKFWLSVGFIGGIVSVWGRCTRLGGGGDIQCLEIILICH